MPLMLDPFNSQENKAAMGRRAKPSYFDQALSSPYMQGGPNGQATAVAQQMLHGGGEQDDPAPAPAASASRRIMMNPSASDVFADQAPQLGMRRLAPGVTRSEVPGVYIARGKDGTFMASNIMGADGQPDFGAVAHDPGVPMHQRSQAYAGGTEVAPRQVVRDWDGWSARPGAQGGAPDPVAGQVDPNGLRGLPARSTAPDAGFTGARASGSLTANDIGHQIDAATNPFVVQKNAADLAAHIDADPRANNPEVAAANNQAMRRLTGAYYDRLHQFYGGTGAQAAMMGSAMSANGVPVVPGMGVGTGSGRGGNVGTFVRDIAQAHADTANAQTNAAKAEAEAQAKQAAQNETQIQNTIKANGLDTPESQARLAQLGLDPRSYARMQQFLEHGGDINSSNPEAAFVRQQIQHLVGSGLAQARGPLDQLGNALSIDKRPYFDASNPAAIPSYHITSDFAGNPVLAADDGNYANLGGAHRLRQTYGYGDSSPMLRAAWNDPVLQRLIAELGQRRMARRGAQ